MTDADPPSDQQNRTVGGFDRSGRRWVLTLFGLGGAVVGALLPVLTRWAAELPWVPFQGPLRLVGSFDEPWLTWGRPGLGLVAGLAFAAWVIYDSPVLDIGREQIQVRRRGQVERVIERATVAAVHPRRSTIVIETASGRKLFERDVEGDRAAVRSAFVELGYPWEGPRD
ncbi:YqeB family protein [Cellulomonas sp. P5_C5]